MKTKIVVIKLKDILFYATVVVLCIILLLLLFILFQPEATPTNSTIEVYAQPYNILHTYL
ncbi:MAG: hypothetical protein IKJ16_07550 [Agathobacter sp.]|nr:hypothetical protein [Agathobacter sp.]